MKRMRLFTGALAVLGAVALAAPGATAHSPGGPVLAGRAVLPVKTYAPGPPSGTQLTTQGEINGYTIPTRTQPVEGFSALLSGRYPGEYLAMPDNGWGGKANSVDFLIRAYWIRPDFKTDHGGTGDVRVGSFLSFRDPYHRIGFTIVNEASHERLLTGGDIDPESLQRAPDGSYWMGEEFGPWLLHFSSTGVLLEAPYRVPGPLVGLPKGTELRSPNNPFLAAGEVATHLNSRGFEAIALSTDGRHLYSALEGPTVADGTSTRRYILDFDIRRRAFTGTVWHYTAHAAGNMLADMAATGDHEVVLIERDGLLGEAAITGFRGVYAVDLRHADRDGNVTSRRLVDLTRIADPDLVSQPPIHEGDVGLATAQNPYFSVTCESIEAIHPLDGDHLMLGCDNNLPNKGRNKVLADDSEFIVVALGHDGDHHDR